MGAGDKRASFIARSVAAEVMDVVVIARAGGTLGLGSKYMDGISMLLLEKMCGRGGGKKGRGLKYMRGFDVTMVLRPAANIGSFLI